LVCLTPIRKNRKYSGDGPGRPPVKKKQIAINYYNKEIGQSYREIDYFWACHHCNKLKIPHRTFSNCNNLTLSPDFSKNHYRKLLEA